MLGCVVCLPPARGARRVLKAIDRSRRKILRSRSNQFKICILTFPLTSICLRCIYATLHLALPCPTLEALSSHISTIMISLRPRSIRQAVLLTMMMFMLAAYASARIAASEVQEQENQLEQRRLTGCDTGSNCDCPDDMTKLFLLDIPFICVPLQVADIIFVTFVPFLTCCALPEP
jgi:hypothetical protein